MGVDGGRLLSILVVACVSGSAWFLGVVAQPASEDLGFGTDARAVTDDPRLWHLQYGTLWVGVWNHKAGWQTPEDRLERMRVQGVVPVVHLYYWGDDLTPRCFEDGCWSSLHDAHKDREGWHRLTEGLLTRLNGTMDGGRVVIILEDEFNQIHTKGHDGFDHALARMAEKIRAGYPAAEIVLPFGNWNVDAWATWDEAAAASDMIGIQALRGSTRHGPDAYADAFAATLRGAERLHVLFGKPLILHDVGFSSYPEPAFLKDQAEALQTFFDGLPALRAAGVQAFMYRSFRDEPSMDPANWFGEAERHWGLAWSGNGTLKPAGIVWLAGVSGSRTTDDIGVAPGLAGRDADTSVVPGKSPGEDAGEVTRHGAVGGGEDPTGSGPPAGAAVAGLSALGAALVAAWFLLRVRRSRL